MASTKNLVHQLKDNTFKCFLETHKLVLVAFEYSALYEPNERLSMALQQVDENILPTQNRSLIL